MAEATAFNVGVWSHRRETARIVLPLALGFTIYLLWRPTSLWMFVWLDMAGLTNSVGDLRRLTANAGTMLPLPVLYNLPAACWSYSFCIVIALIWKRAPMPEWWAAITCALVVTVGGEVLQLAPGAPGVFDLADCAADAAAGLLGVWAVPPVREKTVCSDDLFFRS